jgi:hypothetical protein
MSRCASARVNASPSVGKVVEGLRMQAKLRPAEMASVCKQMTPWPRSNRAHEVGKSIVWFVANFRQTQNIKYMLCQLAYWPIA